MVGRNAVAEYLNGRKWPVYGAKLVIAKLDRLSRDAHFLLGLEKAGVDFVAADMPNANQLTVGIMATVAEEAHQRCAGGGQDARQKAPNRKTGALNTPWQHPYNIQLDGKWMVCAMSNNVHELRPKPADTEKITINLGYVDLGHVDLMVEEGFYSNRTDFIRTAIRNQIERHADVVKQSTARKSLDLGLRNYSREDLETVRRTGEMLHINVLGLATIAQDVTPELARATIASVSVLGALHASSAVKAALADRTR